MEKLRSRKLWMAVAGAVLVILNEGLGLGINSEAILAFAGIVIAYILGQGAVDTARAARRF